MPRSFISFSPIFPFSMPLLLLLVRCSSDGETWHGTSSRNAPDFERFVVNRFNLDTSICVSSPFHIVSMHADHHQCVQHSNSSILLLLWSFFAVGNVFSMPKWQRDCEQTLGLPLKPNKWANKWETKTKTKTPATNLYFMRSHNFLFHIGRIFGQVERVCFPCIFRCSPFISSIFGFWFFVSLFLLSIEPRAFE